MGNYGFTCWISFALVFSLFTVESLSLLYLLFISWFICSRSWCIDKLGFFHANLISMCLDPHLNKGWGWHRETGLSPPVKYFYWPFQVGTSFVDHLCYLCFVFVMPLCKSVYLCLVDTCWERADCVLEQDALPAALSGSTQECRKSSLY